MTERGGEDGREGLSFSNLDQELFNGAGATKDDLVDYLDAVSERIISVLTDRPRMGRLLTTQRPPLLRCISGSGARP